MDILDILTAEEMDILDILIAEELGVIEKDDKGKAKWITMSYWPIIQTLFVRERERERERESNTN